MIFGFRRGEKSILKRFSVEDLWKLKRPAGVSLSADGSRAVVSLTSYSMKENRASASLWLLSTSGGKPRLLTTSGEKDSQPAWSPDGSSIAFVAKREWQGKKDDEPQVYLIDPDGGEARRLTQLATGVAGVKWFADGKRVAFFSWVWPELRGTAAQARRMKERKEDKVKAHVVEQYTYRFWDHWLADGRVPHLFVADVSTGACRDLFEGTPYELARADPDQHVFDVSPDGRFIAFGYDPAPEKKLDDEFDIVELELRTRRFRNLTQGEPHRDYHHPRYSPDGARIACLSADIRRNARAQNQITLIERRTKRIEIVSRRWDRWVEAPLRWSGDGKEILCVAQDQARAHLYRFDLPARSAQIAVSGGVVMEFDFAGGTTAYVRSEMDTPPAVYAGEDGARRKLERFNDALLKPFRFGPTEEVRFKGFGGNSVQMWLVFPPGFDPRKKYPLLHSIHGGPHTASSDGWHYRWCNHAFAAQGYVVAAVNYHGSSSFGQAFIDSIHAEYGKRELADIEAATDVLVRRRYIDRRRVFASGGSYGGYMVAWMNGRVPHGKYRAYICHAGCFDWVSMFADDTYPFHAKEFGAWYWKDLRKVEAQSPRAFAGRMTTPTLVIHGALDFRVPETQGFQYYNTLKARGVPTRLLHFPDENHWILKPQNSRLWYREFFAWLKRFDDPQRRPAAP